MCAGAILTQSAAWTNAAKALTRLKETGALSPRALDGMAEAEVAELVRSSGYFNAKARKLKAFSAHVCRWYDGDIHRLLARPLEELREELLGIHGVGEETADDMVLYAAGKPSFVVDAYTRRIFDRLGDDAAAGCRRRGAGSRCRKTAGAGALVRGLAGAVHGVAGGGCAGVQRVPRADSGAGQGRVPEAEASLLRVPAGGCLRGGSPAVAARRLCGRGWRRRWGWGPQGRMRQGWDKGVMRGSRAGSIG